MKNSIVKPKSSMFLPPLRSQARQACGEKNELIRDEKIDSIGPLSRMIDKLHINENMRRKIINNSVQEATTQEEVAEHDFKKMAIPFYDIDEMSPQELQASLHKIRENPKEPFSFLANISRVFTDEDQLSAEARKPTEIDMRLAAVAKRIESSKALLEEAKSHVKEICLCTKRDDDSSTVRYSN